MAFDITDEKLDQILAEVGQVAEDLAKSQSLKKGMDDGDKPQADAKDDAMAAPAPTAAAAPEPPPAAPEAPPSDAPAEMPPGEGEAMDAEPTEQALEGEQGGEGELSDDELNEIYGGMPPEELERHFMVMRQYLQQHYAKAEMSGKSQPAIKRPPQGTEVLKDEQGCTQPAIKRPPQGTEVLKSEDGMANDASTDLKSEIEKLKKDNAAIKAQYEGLEKANENLVAAIESRMKPSRRAVTDLETVRKSEADAAATQNKKLSADEKKDKLRTLVKSEQHRLTRAQREAINNFFVYNADEDAVDEILKGGNK
jgi:hypothetical protein